MHRFVIGLFLSSLIAAAATAGTLTTRDGKIYTGPIRFVASGAQLSVTTDQGPQTFPLNAIAKADFKAGNALPKPGHGLRGEYFVGRNLHRVLLTRNDACIDFNWNEVLPHPALAPVGRQFSVRWTAQLRPDFTEKYTIISNSDDGVRVYLGGHLIIDHWSDQSGADLKAEVLLEKDRKYDLRVEYYNGQDDAYTTLSWQSTSVPRQVIPSENLYLPPATARPASTQTIRLQNPSTDGGPPFERVFQSARVGLKAEYFADRELNSLNFIRFDPTIDIQFHPDNPPDPVMSPEGSIRWTGMLEPRYTEDYRFHIEVRRRVRLWVDNKLIIDEWKGEGAEYTSDPIALVAGKKVPFKVEYTSPNGFMLCRVRWSSKSQGRDTISPDAFSVADDEPLSPPVLGLVYPAADAFIAAPGQVALLATGFSPNGGVKKFEFFNGNTHMAALNAQPYRLVLTKPAPGLYNIRAKITDTAGVTALSESHSLTITGKGNGSIRAPWGDFYIANNDSKTPGTASQNGDAFTIENAVGTLLSESEPDAAHFIVQPLNGDGQIVGRIVSVMPGPDDGVAGAMAGITIRENLSNRCKQFSLLYGQSGEEPTAAFVRRQDHWKNPVTSEKTIKGPVWFKLARYGGRVYAYTSTDGKSWDLFGSERFDAGADCFVGMVAFSSVPSKAATARFDRVKLLPGAPALESAVKGFVTRGGTFVAADVFAIDENLVRFVRNNAQESVPLNEVARILYKPLLADQMEGVSPGRTGLLMSNGDFLEGDVRSLKDGAASVSSVLFGLRKVTTYDDLTAIILHDVAPEKTPFTLTTADGSLYRVKSLKPTPQAVQIDDASLGAVTLPLAALAQLRTP